MQSGHDLNSLFQIETPESSTPAASTGQTSEVEQLRYKVFKITGSKKFVISKDLFAPVYELSYKQRTFKGLESDIIKQLKQYQQLGVYQTVLIFI